MLAKEASKVKRKKFATMRVHEVLNDLSRDHFQFDVSQCEEMKDCYICHKCKLRVERLPEHLQKAEMEKNTVLDMLESCISSKKRFKRIKKKCLSESETNEEAAVSSLQDASDV